MAFGRGLESLIPPQEERKEVNDTNEPQGGEINVRVEPQSPAAEISNGQEETQPETAYERKEPEEKVHGTVFQIEVDRIKPNPHQPRRDFDDAGLKELAASIREFGVLQPIVISKVERESDTGWTVFYELVAGERRLMASKLAGLHTIPAIIRKESADREKLELAVIENIQRSDLNPIEFARAVARLQDEFGLTQREISVRLGKSREVIANAVRLLGLPTNIQESVAKGEITESHARILLSVDDPALQNEAFEDIIGHGLNVRETDARVKRGRGADGTREALIEINPEITNLKGKLEEFLGTKVLLQSKGASGKITINFYSPEELEAIVDKVTRQSDNQSPLPPLEP